jgi:uncharacterized repeat protein (TIGR03803 family)
MLNRFFCSDSGDFMTIAAVIRCASACLAAIGLMAASIAPAFGIDLYNPSSRQLTIPSITIGAATYTDLVVTVSSVDSPPIGTAPTSPVDSYFPSSHQLYVAAVSVGSKTYYNAAVTLAGLVSLGGVTGADTYAGGILNVVSIPLGTTLYDNVSVQVGSILSHAGGLPAVATDTYNPTTGQLTIPVVVAGGKIYTNVVVSVAKVLGVGYSYSNAGPGAPTAVGATAVAGQIAVYWSAVDQATSYLIFRSETPGIQGAQIGSSTGSGYIDSAVTVGTPYYYVVAAADSFGNGAPSQPTSGVTPVTAGESVLHSFGGGIDGLNTGIAGDSGNAGGLIQGSDGNFYGMTCCGGKFNKGAIFRITAEGSESVVYSFAGGADGASPSGSLIEGKDGNFYGTTFQGGSSAQAGTFFRVTPDGLHTVLYAFNANGDGAYPTSGVIQGSDGNFYGITREGGDCGYNQCGGVAFRVTASGAETVICDFPDGSPGGLIPYSFVQGKDGNFYGTVSGGANNLGAFYQLTPAGTETVLYSFTSADGTAGPVLFQGTDGNFYGATTSGGNGSVPFDGVSGAGTVFRITPAGVESVLYSFVGYDINDQDCGFYPNSLIQGNDGNLYGTCFNGGTYTGVFFQVTPAGVESVLYPFQVGNLASNGGFPLGVIQGTDGNFYGVTSVAGPLDTEPCSRSRNESGPRRARYRHSVAAAI